MPRIFAVLIAVSLVLAPAALAKGPHVVLLSGPEPPEPGQAWEATLELNEFRHVPRPFVGAEQGERSASVEVRRVSSDSATGFEATSFETTIVFPRAGRWRIHVSVGKHSFRIPAIAVGTGKPPEDYVAFPIGSEAAEQGAGGIYMTDGGPLPPEVVRAPEDVKAPEEEDGGGGVAIWLLPLAGLVLAGAGVAMRRRPRGRRRDSGGPRPPSPR